MLFIRVAALPELKVVAKGKLNLKKILTVFFALETLDSGCSKVVKKYWFSPLSMYAGKDCEEDYWGFLQVVSYYVFCGGGGGRNSI